LLETTGKVAQPAGFSNGAGIEPAGFCHLPVTGLHAAVATDLAPRHKDPFDRMLVAQALCEPMILLTDDAALAGYGPFVTVA
jgi:PIN domain nuclease of toxin-antitoxin system